MLSASFLIKLAILILVITFGPPAVVMRIESIRVKKDPERAKLHIREVAGIRREMDHSTVIDIDRRKYPDWLRRGTVRRYPTPVAIIEIPEGISAEKLKRIKEEFVGKGYHIVMRPERLQ